jgi:hypothetical protein
MTPNTWYMQSFSDEILYFRPSGEIQKNSKRAGLMVTVDLTRPRAKPRSKKIAVHPLDFGLWRAAETVPAEVALLAM